ncbi:MAG: hypothetical protein IBX44_08045 [Sulfurospirillum sp.]|nr:hypothetical protein [Sulfurospirillum sp.]
MDALNATTQMRPEMYALKQATKVQEEIIGKLLNSLQTQSTTQTQSVSGLKDQGIGATLDIKG